APPGRVLLARRDADVDRVSELGVRLVLIRLERLLHPVDADLLDLASDLDRALGVRDVAEAGVDHDLDAVAGCLLGGRGERDIVLWLPALEAPSEPDAAHGPAT